MSVAGRGEVVGPVPGTVRERRARDRERSGMEVREPPGPARERDRTGEGHEIEHDMPYHLIVARSRPTEAPGHREREEVARRGVEAPHARLDRGDVRGRD